MIDFVAFCNFWCDLCAQVAAGTISWLHAVAELAEYIKSLTG
jgi:hypothetical protein